MVAKLAKSLNEASLATTNKAPSTMHWRLELLSHLMHLAPHLSTFALEEVLLIPYGIMILNPLFLHLILRHLIKFAYY